MSIASPADGLPYYESGYDQSISEDRSFHENRSVVRQRTSSLVSHAFVSEQALVVRAPPASGKTHAALEHAANHRRTVVLGLQTYDLVNEKADEAREKHDARVLTIKSAYLTCPSYTGELGEDIAETVDQCSVTPGRLHELAHSESVEFSLPCIEHGCPYMEQFNEDFEQYDAILTTHGMLRAETLVEEYNVVVDEFAKDTYITEVENARGVVNHYLEFIDSPLGVWGGARQAEKMDELSSHNLQVIDHRAAWEQECITHAGEENHPTHVEANLLVKALIHGKQVGQQIHHQIDSRREVLITGDSAKILHRPGFEEAHSVVGFDATASERMWQQFVHRDVEVVDTVDDSEKRILWEQSGGELALLGDHYAQHASGGNIAVVPTEHAQQMLALTHGTAYTFSTKAVKERTSLEVDGYYGRDDKGTNKFGDADALLLAGAPHPGDDVIIETAAWFGENAIRPSREDPREMGVNLSYGSEVADEIFAQYREARVEQAIYRGNRMDGSGLSVLSTTACLPEWMPVEDELPMPGEPGAKETAVLEALERRGTATTRELVEHVHRENDRVDSVSERHVRRVLTKYTRSGIVSVGQDPADGRVKRYEYSDLSISEIPRNLADVVCSEFANGACPVDSGSIRQAVEQLMQMSWSDLDWAEWIARQELNDSDSAPAVT